MKMSLRDIGEIVNRAKQEKERQEHKSLSVQAYDKFSKDKTPRIHVYIGIYIDNLKNWLNLVI
jgi:hypothetical protein